MLRRFLVFLVSALLFSLTLFSVQTDASVRDASSGSDAAKAGCLIASIAYSGGPVFLGAEDNLAAIKKVKDAKLQKIVKALLKDDSNPATLKKLESWCKSHFPKVPEVQAAKLIPPTTTTIPPTTTTTVPKVSVYDGSGDDVIQIAKPSTVNIAAFHYAGPSNFIVTGLDANQQRTGGLVNEIGAYDGVVPLDFLTGQATAFFQIKASGPWHIEIRPLSTVRTFTTTIDGTGDEVVSYASKGGITSMTHDGSSNFIVVAYTTTRTGLVNEIGPYQGRVLLPTGPGVIEIKGDGHWTISIG